MNEAGAAPQRRKADRHRAALVAAAAAPQGRWRRWRDEVTIAALLALVAAALALGGWAWRLDRVVYDLGLLLWSRPAPPDIVIVAIDDASIEAIGRWPWRRAVHATLLAQLAQARPRAVALDLVLSEADPDPEQDRLLAAALRAAAPVVLPVATASIAGAVIEPLLPTPVLREAAWLGAADAAVDADGVLRSAFLRAGPPGSPYPHLALALAQAGGEAVDPRLQVEHAATATGGAWQRDGRFLIRYAGPPGSVEQISYLDVLRGAVPAARLAGRYVLVGMTAQGLGDTLATPVNASHRAMPGVEALAHTLYTLRSGDTVHALSERGVALLSALLLAALVASFGRFGPRRALPTAVVAVPLAVGASLLALRGGLWCNPVPFALAAVLAYPLWSWRRLERAVAGLDEEIARLDIESADGGVELDPVVGRDAIEARLLSLQRTGRLLRQARRFLADALAAMPAAMLVADERGRVLLANARAAAVFDVESAQELDGLDLMRLLDELRTADHFDWRAAVAELQPSQAGLAVQGRSDDGVEYVVHVATVELHGLRRLIVILSDIEAIKQAQREREEALAFVSHDLRSPASSIVLLADLELDGGSPAPREELLLEIKRLATRTLELSEDFVRASQARSQALQLTPVSATQLVAAAMADLGPQAAAAGVTLSWVVPALQPTLLVDRLLLVRAIANLISNAIKHSTRGGAVELRALCEAGQQLIIVRDHGSGLSAEQVEQIARGDEGAAVQDARGVGLGLLFVQRVARRHGGALRAGPPSSGPGALFELALPLPP